MSEIELGGGCDAELLKCGVLIIDGEFGSALLPPDQMDAICKWWLEQRGSVQLLEIAALAVAEAAAKEQQAIEAHRAGRSRPISDIISDLRKEQP